MTLFALRSAGLSQRHCVGRRQDGDNGRSDSSSPNIKYLEYQLLLSMTPIRLLPLSLLASITIAGCGTTMQVTPAATSKSQFDGAAYAGAVSEAEKPTPGAELYRAFQQGATGFVPVSGVRGGVEELATNFCKKKAKLVRLIQETTSPALFLPGNFPRVEWLFECTEPPEKGVSPTSAVGDKFAQLERLKKLLDNGALTQKEFEQEKAKILESPR